MAVGRIDREKPARVRAKLVILASSGGGVVPNAGAAVRRLAEFATCPLGYEELVQ
jgi:hypothetical protein